MARWNGLYEVAKLLTHGLVRESADEGVECPKLQPASPLCGGELHGMAQRGRCGVGFAAAVGQLPIGSPQLGFEIALVAAV
jgi:hypothetical protein